MKFIVLFEDNPDAAKDVRQRNMPAHLDFLDNNKTQIETAGPLYDKTNTTTGGLWIVDAADEIAVERLVETDPLWATGLRRSFAVRRWTQVFANGKATGLP